MAQSSNKKVRVMIADASDVYIMALRKLLESDKRVEVVCVARTGAECLQKAQREKPTVVLMDLKFKDMGGGRVVRELSDMNLEMAVLILSPYAVKDSTLLLTALQAGAFDFILRPRSVSELEIIKRQILTQIFVAALTKSKQIPKRGDGETKNEGKNREFEAVYLEIAPERLTDLRIFIGGLRAGFPVAVVVLIRQSPALIRSFAAEQLGSTNVQPQPAKPGDELANGQLYLVGTSADDLVVERTGSRCVAFKSVPRKAGAESAAGPCSVVLVESLARAYGSALAVAASGINAPDCLEALIVAQKSKALVLVEETSAAMLEQAFKKFPAGGFPDDIPSMMQIQSLVNG